MVDEEVGGALATHPALKDLLVLSFLERILQKRKKFKLDGYEAHFERTFLLPDAPHGMLGGHESLPDSLLTA